MGSRERRGRWARDRAIPFLDRGGRYGGELGDGTRNPGWVQAAPQPSKMKNTLCFLLLVSTFFNLPRQLAVVKK